MNRIEDRFSRQVLRCLQRGPSLRGRETRPCLGILEENFDFVQPEPARAEDLLLVHSQAHVSHVEHDTHLFEAGSLAVGGAIRASEISLTGEPAFGLMRPPGHHASPNSCWGFCYFNNIAIATRRLIHAEEIERALIVDFDLHFGDGTANTFGEEMQAWSIITWGRLHEILIAFYPTQEVTMHLPFRLVSIERLGLGRNTERYRLSSDWRSA